MNANQITDPDAISRVEEAAMKVCGFDRVTPEVRTVVAAMAQRYGLELPLRHLIPIEGRPFLTRDGLLHIAHRSGQLDGIVLEDEGGNANDGWWAIVTVYRKGMSHGFRFRGRYNGPNKRFGPEMALKCAESMGLRRAFDVSIPTEDEQTITPSEDEVREQARIHAPLPPAAPAPTCEPTAWAELQAALKGLRSAQPALDPKATIARLVGRPVTRDTITSAEARAAAKAMRQEAAASRALAAQAPPAPAPDPAADTIAEMNAASPADEEAGS